MPKIQKGYILLARRITESGIMDKPPLYFKLWVWMLEQANHQDNYKGLRRGQFFTTIEEMREAMSWHIGYRKVTPTRKEIRNPYEWFMKGHMIDIAKVTHGMVITILNYDEYQNPKNYEGHTEGPHEKDTKGQRGAQYKQEGEECKNGIYTESFLKFWGVYPKKVGKGDAFKAWQKIKSPKPTTEEIIQAVQQYNKTEQWQTTKYIPNPATFINRRQWEDEINEVENQQPHFDPEEEKRKLEDACS